MSVLFIIKFKVKSEKQADFHTVMKNVKCELPEVEGCIGVDIHQSDKDESNYVLVESWESKAFHQKHVEGLISSGVWESIAEHLAEDPIGDYYKII